MQKIKTILAIRITRMATRITTMANMETIKTAKTIDIKVAIKKIMSIIKIMPEPQTTRQLRLQGTLLKTKWMPIMEEPP